MGVELKAPRLAINSVERIADRISERMMNQINRNFAEVTN